MFWMDMPGWAWNWGWAAFIGAIIVLGIFLVPWFFFLLNLHTLLDRVSDRNRAMPAAHVWLNFIPVFNLGWFIYTAMKVRDSVKAEYQARGWAADGDFGYNVGLAAGVLAIALFFIGWVPVLGWGLGIALLVCWIIYWLKTSDFKNRLGETGAWQGSAPYGPYQGRQGSQGPGAPFMAPPAGGPPRTPPSYPPATAGPPAAAPTPEEASGGAAAPRLCAGCGAVFDPEDRFCRTCGLPLPRA
jgi:hypothetical protein